MKEIDQRDMPHQLERYEMKFVIPDFMIDSISEFASIYCSLDKYSAMAGNQFYRVNNLYFDSPNYLFLKNRINGSDNRFNMRIRTYGNTPESTCFLEIKQKKVNIIRKFRSRSDKDEWQGMFQTPGYVLDEKKESRKSSNKHLFFRLACTYNAAPKILTQYVRKAYVSDIDDYARVTFDTDLRYQPEEEYTLAPDDEKMIPLDNETIFDSGCNVILELKCHSANVPLWMIDLIRCFNLRKRSFSKYVTGVSNVLGLYKYDSSFRQSVLGKNEIYHQPGKRKFRFVHHFHSDLSFHHAPFKCYKNKGIYSFNSLVNLKGRFCSAVFFLFHQYFVLFDQFF